MKNTCPKCDTAYNVSVSTIGRKFTCKNCNTPVVVTDEGLDYQNPPTKAPPAAKASPAAKPAAAFDFDAGGGDEEEERKPAKPAKAAKPAKRPRDEDEEDPEELADDDFDAAPKRKPKKRSGEKSLIKDFLFFREFIAPLVVKFVFVLALVVILVVALIGFVGAVLSGNIGAILGALVSLVIGVPLMMLVARVYAELILLGFALYDRLGEIKTLLEQQKPPAPPAP